MSVWPRRGSPRSIYAAGNGATPPPHCTSTGRSRRALRRLRDHQRHSRLRPLARSPSMSRVVQVPSRSTSKMRGTSSGARRSSCRPDVKRAQASFRNRAEACSHTAGPPHQDHCPDKSERQVTSSAMVTRATLAGTCNAPGPREFGDTRPWWQISTLDCRGEVYTATDLPARQRWAAHSQAQPMHCWARTLARDDFAATCADRLEGRWRHRSRSKLTVAAASLATLAQRPQVIWNLP